MNKTLAVVYGKALYHMGVKDINFELYHKRLGEPYFWTNFPVVIQLDLTNRCGPKHCGVLCCYCRPQRDILRGLKQEGEMSLEVLDWVLKDVSKFGRKMSFICDFLDGDGSDPILPERRKRIKKAAPWLTVQTFTCGTRPQNASLLIDKNLDWINVTLSAHNEAVYKQVHGGDKFHEVLQTMRYITEHRLPSQKLEVHYVINKFNIAYMKDWLTLMKTEFADWEPKFSPLVNTGADDASNTACGMLSTLDQENAIKELGASAFWDRRELGMKQPCVLWHNASVTAAGDLLQCCRWDTKDWDYGNAQEYIRNGWGFRDYWMKKLVNRLRNPFCERCNLKCVGWQHRANAIDVRGVICEAKVP